MHSMQAAKESPQKLGPADAAAPQAPDTMHSAIHGNIEDDEDSACIICLDQPACIVFSPCSHCDLQRMCWSGCEGRAAMPALSQLCGFHRAIATIALASLNRLAFCVQHMQLNANGSFSDCKFNREHITAADLEACIFYPMGMLIVTVIFEKSSSSLGWPSQGPIATSCTITPVHKACGTLQADTGLD